MIFGFVFRLVFVKVINRKKVQCFRLNLPDILTLASVKKWQPPKMCYCHFNYIHNLSLNLKAILIEIKKGWFSWVESACFILIYEAPKKFN
jgi:hypothetical protein